MVQEQNHEQRGPNKATNLRTEIKERHLKIEKAHVQKFPHVLELGIAGTGQAKDGVPVLPNKLANDKSSLKSPPILKPLQKEGDGR